MATNAVDPVVADTCMEHVLAAGEAENEAVALDRDGKRKEAIEKYRICARELEAAISTALPNHAEDKPKLVTHKEQVMARINTLTTNPSTTSPVEDQIKTVQLAMAGASAASSAASSAGGMRQMAAVAGVGAIGGAIVLGGTVGFVGVGAIGGAAAAAYCATRQDKVGDAARMAGGVALKAGARAQQINQEHKITEKLADASSKAVEKAQEVNSRYGITTKIAEGASRATAAARQIDERHHVTDKVATGVSRGLGRMSSLLGPRAEANPSAVSSAGPPK